jgi:hypothetical protein
MEAIPEANGTVCGAQISGDRLVLPLKYAERGDERRFHFGRNAATLVS